MTTVTAPAAGTRLAVLPPERRTSRLAAFATLARRRFALSAHTPREIVVPLLTPILFADVIAPALAASLVPRGRTEFMSFVAVGTIGLLVPLSCVLAGIGIIVDRDSGAQRDMLAAPVRRGLFVLGNLTVTLALCSLQVGALLVAARARGASFSVSAAGVAWAAGAALGIAI